MFISYDGIQTLSSMALYLQWKLVCALASLSSVQASKVLLMPAATYSHCVELSSIGQELVNRGHNVSILFSVTYEHKNCHVKHATDKKRINTILLTPPDGAISTDKLVKEISNSMVDGEDFSILKRVGTMQQLVAAVCGNSLADANTLKTLKMERFDLVILDGGFMSYCMFVVPYVLNVPYVAVSTLFEDFVSGRPFLPSISPNVLSTASDSMTFFQRLQNGAMQVLLHAMAMYLIPMDMVSTVAPELSRRDIIDLVSKSELFLYNCDTVLGYPLPQMPNHVFIGGVGAHPASPLTGEFKQYYEQSPKGVVVATFGGNDLKLPESKTKALLRVFQKLELNVLWKYSDNGQDGNVKRMKWVPQNDLLGHPKTTLFVSHCGNNGVFEALFHGVPLVCTPIIGDQYFNGGRVQHWEVGVSVPLMGSTEEQIHQAILEVLRNPKYKENMKRASEMYHSQPKPPRERAADAIEHVLRFGGDHLRSRASDMCLLTYMGYDLLCFVLGVLVSLSLILVKCVQCLCKCCRGATPKEKTS